MLETHVHADHVSGGRLLADRVGATYALHESAEVRFPFERLRDGDVHRRGSVLARRRRGPDRVVRGSAGALAM